MIATHAAPLEIALLRIADKFDLSRLQVIQYAAQDPHGGYNSAYEDGFPTGSVWRVEGQMLYALIRALEPQSVLELGTWHGASATHILQALKDNGRGSLDCVDNRAYGDVQIGHMIPDEVRHLGTIHPVSLETCIEIALHEGYTYDVIFEDAMHEAPQVEYVWQNAERLLNPGGLIISHDAMHPTAGPIVREGIARAGYGDKTVNVLIQPADCGFALWRKGL
jgi:predicted O-methyltransferase YrrM